MQREKHTSSKSKIYERKERNQFYIPLNQITPSINNSTYSPINKRENKGVYNAPITITQSNLMKSKVQTYWSTSHNEFSLVSDNVEELVDLTLKLEDARELETKINEIEDIRRYSANNKINLSLYTVFNSDSELNLFILSLSKIMINVINLKWIIKGSLIDNGSGQLVGRVLRLCKTLHTLHLELIFPFLDNSASELGQSLQKHKDMKILKLWIINPDLISGKNNYFGYMGNFKINDSILSLRKLQFLEYNNLFTYFSRINNLYNLVFPITSEYDEVGTPHQRGASNKKIFAQQLQMREYKITNLIITNNTHCLTYRDVYQGFKWQKEEQDAEQIYPIQQFYHLQLILINQVFALPYLTFFKVSYFADSHIDEFPSCYPDKQLTKKELILKSLIRQRVILLQRFAVLARHSFNEIPLNPNVLFSDLYFN